MLKIFFLLVSAVLIDFGRSKVFSKCELAEELVKVHNETLIDAKKFVCVAEQSSRYSTQYSTVESFGIFNITSDQSAVCNISKSNLLDDDIEDDLICANTLPSFNGKFQLNNDQACADISFDECDFFDSTRDTTVRLESVKEIPNKKVITTSTSGDIATDSTTDSTPKEEKPVQQEPRMKTSKKQDSRQDRSKEDPESVTKLLLLNNYVQRPKPDVNLEIFLFE